MVGNMLSIILINVLVQVIITWLFILIRKFALKMYATKFDINIVTFTVMVAGGIYYNYKNYLDMSEFLAKSIIEFLSFVIYIFFSMKLFRKSNSQKEKSEKEECEKNNIISKNY